MKPTHSSRLNLDPHFAVPEGRLPSGLRPTPAALPLWSPGLLLALLLTVAALGLRAADNYPLTADSQPQVGVLRGTITQYEWNHSAIFPGTERHYWVYVPAQYDPAKAACVLVLQDGKGLADGWHLTTVLDNLIHQGQIPVTVGVFIDHGRVPPPRTNALTRFNRSFEYDELGDRYARFLLEEILPEVGRNFHLSTNANDRLIAGASSGAICAFTAAWERPDAFSRVLSTIGTYVGLRGGNEYPILIRKTEPKPIRVFLQDGSSDQDIYGGNWFLANQEMLSALEFAGYEVNHAWGDGGHNSRHGAAILPDALRWLWKDYPAPIRAGANPRQPVMEIVIPGEGWQVASAGHRFTEGPTANAQGEVFFTDIPNSRIHKIGLDGKVTVFAENTGNANGLSFGPDGKLYACQDGKKRIVSYAPDGSETVISTNVGSNDIAVSEKGDLYFTDPGAKKVWRVNPQGERQEVDAGLITFPNGIRFTPDQTLLLVDDTRGQFVYSFQVRPDGSLAAKQPYFHLHLPPGQTESGADGMTLDTQGRLYVATQAGLQVCDQAGRVIAIIPKPQRAWLSNVCFGGANFDELYVTCGDRVYKRKTKAKGVLSWKPPLVPAPPRL